MNRPSGPTRFALAAGLLATLPLAAAASSAAPPSLSLAPLEGGQLQVLVEGQWAPRCLPAPANAWAKGQDIHVELRLPKAQCGSDPKTAFELRSGPIDLPTGAGLGQRPWRLHLTDADSGRLLAFSLAGGEGQAADAPESGLWWPEAGGEFDTSGPGFGAQIEVQQDTLAINVSGYDADGAPTWWFGAAPLSRPTQAIELSVLGGGGGPFGAYSAPKQLSGAGTLHVEWRGSARAVFWFLAPAADGQGLELRPVSMTRFAFATRPGESWTGDWVLHREPAEGASSVELHRFEWLDGDAESFELLSDRGQRLACRRGDAMEQAPRACQLLPLGSGRALRFTDVGLDGMVTRHSGERISLRRLR
ncbi:hypothetical protein [Pseudomarimonas salicorniae]|uniref:Uncharacterized protein n=1 Tax=Pseudomarimonas salicorniae TaxID=2933270 RepID=A0ABT0GDG5_9GAMM|nr:hypothetical protein [Lysobacter sp. CAU 1642]MCK7592584.1 hypothetical protein [Lysobacter sp. CAU 1642]